MLLALGSRVDALSFNSAALTVSGITQPRQMLRLARLRRERGRFYCVLDHTVGLKLYWVRKPQCTLTVSSSWLQALAMAASRLAVSMIGVPSAACRAESKGPGASYGACGHHFRTSSQ